MPCTDSNGNPITYREFDVNSAGPNGRDAERFVVGSDGSVWYTDSHYGDNPSKNGIADFIKIKQEINYEQQNNLYSKRGKRNGEGI